jgi:hypothetical protein
MGAVAAGWASRSVALIVCPGLAVFLAQRGFADVRYDLADLREDPLYLRGSRPMVVVGVLLSLVFAAGVAVARAIARRTGRSTQAGGPEAAESDPATGPMPSHAAGAWTMRVPLPRAAITISNALRADAIPVFVFDSPLDANPRWSAELEASLLFAPVVVVRGW